MDQFNRYLIIELKIDLKDLNLKLFFKIFLNFNHVTQNPNRSIALILVRIPIDGKLHVISKFLKKL